jgi:hypothetical protein
MVPYKVQRSLIFKYCFSFDSLLKVLFCLFYDTITYIYDLFCCVQGVEKLKEKVVGAGITEAEFQSYLVYCSGPKSSPSA